MEESVSQELPLETSLVHRYDLNWAFSCYMAILNLCGHLTIPPFLIKECCHLIFSQVTCCRFLLGKNIALNLKTCKWIDLC